MYHNISELIDFTNKTVIVTGGSRGIGEGCAKAFLAAGANVVICSRGKANGEKTAAAFCEEYGEGKCIFLPCDVTNEYDVIHVIQETVRIFGKIGKRL